MEQKQKNFKESLAFGQEGEHEVAAALLQMGVTVLPLYQFTNEHAPYILKNSDRIVSPDLICFNSKAFMVEVKTKNQWVEFKGLRETGISKRLFEHYKKIQDATNTTVWLFYNHKEKPPLGIYFCKLDSFTRLWDGMVNGKRVHEPMVFYEAGKLTELK